MKFSASAFVVLASSGTALGSWVDWIPFQKDVTVTATFTRSIQVCPCNGEVRVTQPYPAGGKPTGTIDHYTVTENIDPHWAKPRETITKAGPIVVVFSTAGSMTTKTGVMIELKPTNGLVVTKTIWTGPQPSDDLAWVDWVDSDDNNGGTLTRSHTKTETVYGPAPTDPQTNEPWADWVATSNTKKATTTKSSTKSSTLKSSSTSAARTSSRSGGSNGGSTSSRSSSTSTTSTSTSSSSVSNGPGGYSTTSSSSTSTSTFSSSSSVAAGPGGGSTTGASTPTSTDGTTSTTTTVATDTTTTTTSSFSVGPIGQSTSSSSVDSTTSSPSTSTSSLAGVQTTSTSTTSAAVLPTTSTTSSAAATTTSAGTGSVVVDDVRNLDYITAILQQHNVHRRNHSAVDLTWSPSLAATANTIASSCIYAHNTAVDGGGYGQNIGAGYTPNQVGVMITNDMYNGEFSNYPGPFDQDNIDLTNFNNFGHFTQIVWKNTVQVGCATVTCPGGLQGASFTPYFTVCNYYPAGNFVGQYSNVGAPLGGPIHVVLANAN